MRLEILDYGVAAAIIVADAGRLQEEGGDVNRDSVSVQKVAGRMLLARMQAVPVAHVFVVGDPAERGSSHDQRETVPEEDIKRHGCKLRRTRLAAKCSAIAARNQTAMPMMPSQPCFEGTRAKACPRTPTAIKAVESRSMALAVSFVCSLWIRLHARLISTIRLIIG